MADGLRVLERRGRLVRLEGVPGWLVEAGLGPCGACGGVVFHLVERREKVGEGLVTRHRLSCQGCLPADNRKYERVVRAVVMPPRKKEGV